MTETFLGKLTSVVSCPHCGREVSTRKNTAGYVTMLGHRATLPHTPETPWCAGGGRKVESS